MTRSILVTGATGTVGSEVVKKLLSSSSPRGEQQKENVVVKAAARSANDSTFGKMGEAVQVLHLDYNKPDTLAAALKGVDKLFLLPPFQSNMVDLTSNLVDEARKMESTIL